MTQQWRSWLLAVCGFTVTATLLYGYSPGVTSDSRSSGRSVGQDVFEQRCASCHGTDGRGDGPNAFFLTPKPRDFTTGTYKIRTTESGSIPTDEDLARTITRGLPGTAMPGWGTILHGDTLAAVIAYVKSFSPRFTSERPKAVPRLNGWTSTEASVESGKQVYAELQCGSCHGVDGAGAGGALNAFEDDRGESIQAANLTQPWTFQGGPAAEDIYLRFRTGIDGTPMPSFYGSATEKEMRDLANYVVSLARKPLWEMDARDITALYAKQHSADTSDPVKRGEYLVNAFGCAHCHTPRDSNGEFIAGMKFAGGQKWGLGPYGHLVSYNLTSDSATGLGAWSDEQIKAVLTAGRRRDGSRMLPFPMSWTTFARLTSTDLDAIVAYLRTVPPIKNRIPDPQPLGFFSYLKAKFEMLILKKELVVSVYGGNAGSPPSEGSDSKEKTP